MRRTLRASIILATFCGAVTVPPIFAQAPIFVLPSLDGTPAPHPPATSQPPAPPMARPTNNAYTAPVTVPPPSTPAARPANNAYPATAIAQPSVPSVARPSSNPLPAPAINHPPAPSVARPATNAVTAPPASRHHQPEVTSELSICRKRYADAVYTIGLALWTAPEVQHRALERLLNAAAAAQSAAMDPEPSEQGKAFCSDSTLNDLEATVVRLKAKGWVPLTDVEEHAVTTVNLSDELKHAINGISK
jgi:hypothetical protein